MQGNLGQRKIVMALASLLIVLLSNGFVLSAENPLTRNTRRHELRIGWGDQMFEKLIWQNPQTIIDNMPESFSKTYKENYRYSQHWTAEYQWRANSWLGIGAMLDASGCSWNDVTRNGLGHQTDIVRGRHFWNLLIMPVARFTWLNFEYVSLYSSLGAGLGLNGGTETDALGRHTLSSLAVNMEMLGITADWDRWFAYAEFGGTFSMVNKTTIFLAGSRIISVGAGVRF